MRPHPDLYAMKKERGLEPQEQQKRSSEPRVLLPATGFARDQRKSPLRRAFLVRASPTRGSRPEAGIETDN